MLHRKRRTIVGGIASALVLMLVPVQLSAADADAAAEQEADISIDDAIEIALEHIQGDPSAYEIGADDVADLRVASAYRSAHTGVTHVNLNQHHEGLGVFGAYATVNVTSDGDVLFVGESMVAGLAAATGSVDLDALEAVEAAAEGLELDEPEDLRILRSRGIAEAVVSDGGISEEPIPAQRGWQPTEDGLRLAWQLVIDDAADVHLWNAIVDAETGELLEAESWTSESNLEELALALARPGGASSTSSTLASTASSPPGTTDPVEDGSSYRVFEIPKESPNDGDRTLVTNPADATASPFGWHDTDGVPGADFTVTRGNNVHAYTDHDANNVPDPGSDPDGGPGLTFDFPLDLTKHPHEYSDAAVTNLFYWCNVAHDLFYLYGFDEVSGNFQVNNYGKGGAGGDDVRCEAQDGAGLNNANFSTPAVDGGRPRMQMFLWNIGIGPVNLVTIDPPSSAAGAYGATGANFGPEPDETGVSGDVVLGDDGTGDPNDACQPLIGFPLGAIALVDRGGCTFVLKAQNAQAAGAVAMIVANNVGGNPITMGGTDPTIIIPSVMVSMADGNTIKGGLPATGTVSSNPDAGVLRDGDLESGIVFHEYSHGVSNRLTGGPTINCLTGDERMGEGWSDYHAIAGLIDPELDDPEGPRGMGTYALWQDDPTRRGAGIRPRPYSRNMEIQPFTYDSIKTGAWLNGASLATPHGVGHGWAAVLWDMTWDLIDKHGLNPNIYEPWHAGGNNLAYQLVMDGLKLQGCGPGFVVGRDAIIAADEALTGGENACTLWATFSRRGLGYSAEQGTTNRNDNTEAFDTHPDCLRGFQPPVHEDYGDLDEVIAGDTVPLRFTSDGATGPDVLASNSPFSRRVDCDTLAVPSEGAFITPRERPVDTETPGNSGLKAMPGDRYHYNWLTSEEWAGTCRELVLTRTDGAQHRAFFRFLEG